MVNVATDPVPPEEKVALPANDQELDTLLREATQLQAKVDGNEATRTRRKAAIDADIKARNEPLDARIKLLLDAATPYIKANRAELTGKLKSFETSSATVKFQDDGKGTLDAPDEDPVIALLEKLKGGEAFIEIKKSLRRDALKKWLLGDARPKLAGARVIFNDRLLIQGKITPEQKKRGVKAPVLRRDLEQRIVD